LNDCVNLTYLGCSNNQLTNLILPNNPVNLERLSLTNNSFNQDLSFLTEHVNLKRLYLGNNKFTGSLEYLKDMRQLETLNVDDTDLESGLEYVPESVEKFFCSASQKKDAKAKAIYNLFANDQGEVETD